MQGRHTRRWIFNTPTRKPTQESQSRWRSIWLGWAPRIPKRSEKPKERQISWKQCETLRVEEPTCESVCVCRRVPPHQSKLVDLDIEGLQLSRADLLRFLGEQLVCLQVRFEPVHLHLPTGVQSVVQLCHSWSHAHGHTGVLQAVLCEHNSNIRVALRFHQPANSLKWLPMSKAW